jgi:hypothetical protein
VNYDEQLAESYLKHKGFSSIVYEPDGNIPPDFLAEKSIAVEVRRLNQMIETKDGHTGLEEESIPFANSIQRLLDSVESNESSTWWVSVHFKRPLPSWFEAKRGILQACSEVEGIKAPLSQSIVKMASDNISLRFTKGSSQLDVPFALAAIIDGDSGGFVYDMLSRNIDHCIREKSKKISKYKHRYESWWLILVDHTDYCLSKDELHAIKESRKNDDSWEKIVIISALNPMKSFEL